MRLSKRRLKRIIREEYTRLKRKGLIKETETIDQMQILAACANINAACHTILDKIHQVRMYRVLSEENDDDVNGLSDDN